MITFIAPEQGDDIAGLVRYLTGPGRHNEHVNQRIIAAADTLGVADGTPMVHPRDREQVHALGTDLDSHRKAMGIEMPGGHVWHCSISIRATDRELTDAEWAHVARTAVERLGFTEASGKAPCRWVAVHHGRSINGNEHIHIAVNLVREDGSFASIWNDHYTMSKAAADLEKQFGLSRVEGRAGAGMPGLSRAEIERAARTPGAPEPDRRRLARVVRGCATAATGEADFVRRLRGSGVRVRARYAKGGKSEVVGYSVALATRAPEAPVWFGGGRLAPDLTLPRLREHWPDWDTEVERQAALNAWDRQATSNTASSSKRRTTYGPQVWQQAAQAVAHAREQLAAVPVGEVATWAGAAREAAGILSAWSAQLEDRPGPLAAAADALARSAQTTHDQPRARREGSVADLRGVAMVAFAASKEARGVAGQVALLRQMIRMIEALHQAHQARGQAQQAMALAEASRGQLTQLQSTLTARLGAGPAVNSGRAVGSTASIPPAGRPPGPTLNPAPRGSAER